MDQKPNFKNMRAKTIIEINYRNKNVFKSNFFFVIHYIYIYFELELQQLWGNKSSILVLRPAFSVSKF